MKNNKLKCFDTGLKALLSRKQLRNVYGGYSDLTKEDHDPNDPYCGGGNMCTSNKDCPPGTGCGSFGKPGNTCLRCLSY